MAVIIKPMLPPKKGYVEVDDNGVRKYKDVETGIVYLPNEAPDADSSVWDELDAAYTEGVNSI